MDQGNIYNIKEVKIDKIVSTPHIINYYYMSPNYNISGNSLRMTTSLNSNNSAAQVLRALLTTEDNNIKYYYSDELLFANTENFKSPLRLSSTKRTRITHPSFTSAKNQKFEKNTNKVELKKKKIKRKNNLTPMRTSNNLKSGHLQKKEKSKFLKKKKTMALKMKPKKLGFKDFFGQHRLKKVLSLESNIINEDPLVKDKTPITPTFFKKKQHVGISHLQMMSKEENYIMKHSKSSSERQIIRDTPSNQHKESLLNASEAKNRLILESLQRLHEEKENSLIKFSPTTPKNKLTNPFIQTHASYDSNLTPKMAHISKSLNASIQLQGNGKNILKLETATNENLASKTFQTSDLVNKSISSQRMKKHVKMIKSQRRLEIKRIRKEKNLKELKKEYNEVKREVAFKRSSKTGQGGGRKVGIKILTDLNQDNKSQKLNDYQGLVRAGRMNLIGSKERQRSQSPNFKQRMSSNVEIVNHQRGIDWMKACRRTNQSLMESELLEFRLEGLIPKSRFIHL